MISIHYRNGQVLHGVVLALGDHVVRVAIKDSDDAWEFRLIRGVWVSEDCEVVSIRFTDPREDAEDVDIDPMDSIIGFRSEPARPRHVM